MDKMEHPSAAELLMQLLLALIGVGVMVWSEMPQWQREMVITRIRHASARIVGGLALRSGRRAMRDELDGREHEARAGYRFTRRLSELRDKL